MEQGTAETSVVRESKIEKITSEYNSFLTKTEELENNPNVSINEYTTRSGNVVKQYNLSGANFAFLTHAVGVGFDNNHKNLSEDIKENISIWNSKKKGEANNQISCCLITNDHIIHAGFGKEGEIRTILLGFNHLNNDELIDASYRDHGTPTKPEFTAQINEQMLGPKEILEPGTSNEVITRRYDDNGIARQPDFIIIFNGKIDEKLEKAIDYFKVPIINLKTSEYVDKTNEQIQEELENISQNKSIEELKEINLKIKNLSNNKEDWRRLTVWKYDNKLEDGLKSKILTLEENIVDQQLENDRTEAVLALKMLKENMGLGEIQKVKDIIVTMAKHKYPASSVYYYHEEDHISKKWGVGSYDTLEKTITAGMPDIKKFLKERANWISENGRGMSEKQLGWELGYLDEYAIASKNSTISSVKNYKSIDFIELARLDFGLDLKHLQEPLNEILSAQEELRNIIIIEQKKSEQREEQRLIDVRNTTLGMASNNIEDMIALVKKEFTFSDFGNKIFDKIEINLQNRGNDRMSVLRDLRKNYETIKVSNISEHLIKNFSNDPSIRIIYNLLVTPSQIPELPRETKIGVLEKENSTIAVFVDSKGQESLFKIIENQNFGMALEKVTEDRELNRLNSINRKWLWRLFKGIPKIETDNVYSLPNSGSLLIRNNNDLILINRLSVEKIKMTNLNIETGKKSY